MQQLRDPSTGCAWDIAQTFTTIAPYTIEEAYEVADAIERQDLEDLKDELGDLLLQVVFHAQMASEQSAFDFDAVATAIADKLERRHPHVFGDVVHENDEQRARAWETAKAVERQNRHARRAVADAVSAGANIDTDSGTSANTSSKTSVNTSANSPANSLAVGKAVRKSDTVASTLANTIPDVAAGEDAASGPSSALDDVARALPALMRADKLQRRAARAGFDWPEVAPVWDKLREEIAECHEAIASANHDAIEDELGDLLFTVVNLARHHQVAPEAALTRANAKFTRRFRRVEQLARESGRALDTCDMSMLDAFWNEAKGL